MDPREYDWQMGDLADQSNYPPGVDPSAIGTAVKNWWTNQPSWLDRARAENQRTAEAFQRGGMGEIARQLATDTTEAQDLASGFGGNIKGVKPPIAPGALAATSEYRPPFYSAVEQAVQGAKQNAAPGQQWAGFLRNQPGVKPEEVEALKLGKLFEQPGSVPKEAVLGEIAANRVNVGEVVKQEKRTSETGRTLFQDRDEAALARYQAPYDRLASEQKRFIDDELASVSPTKFGSYTLPGGENYREMLLTLPHGNTPKSARMTEIEGLLQQRRPGEEAQRAALRQEYKRLADETRADPMFKSSHYDEPNILAHVRYNDRVIDGKKTLFVEEVQSDWHQKGKRSGYSGGIKPGYEIRKSGDTWEVLRDGRVTAVHGNEEAARIDASAVGVPDAPFKTTWPELAMKRIIREAAEKGYDKVAWTPGSVQAERYDLSKQIKEVKFEKSGTGGFDRLEDIDANTKGTLIARDHNGKEVMRQHMDASELPDHIGKDVAERLLGQKPTPESRGGMAHASRSLSGLDLQVGGEGMKGFYDEILPATVNKLVKKHGGRVQEGTLPMAKSGEKLPFADMLREAGVSSEEWMAMTPASRHAKLAEIGKAQNVHTIDITPSLRAQAMKGFPLFTAGGVAATGIMGEMARQDEYR